MGETQKMMPIGEFVDVGYLTELNRRFLHPLGLSLATEKDASGELKIAGVIDARDMLGGLVYDLTAEDIARAKRIRELERVRLLARVQRFGFVKQPVPRR